MIELCSPAGAINTLKLHPRRSLFHPLWEHLSGTIQSDTPPHVGFSACPCTYDIFSMHMNRENGEPCCTVDVSFQYTSPYSLGE